MSQIELIATDCAKKVMQRLRRWHHRPRPIEVDATQLLLGGESGHAAAFYAKLTNKPMRASMRLIDGPHVKILELHKQIGDKVLEREAFRQTAYHFNAMEAIDLTGFYHGARNEEGVHRIAQDFIAAAQQTLLGAHGQALQSGPIRVRPIFYSDCYEIIDGHHRAAIAWVRGQQRISAISEPPAVLTPLQMALGELMWSMGLGQLYQPVAAPELSAYKLVRRCDDRASMMKNFLAEKQLLPPNCTSYLDVASYFGWFVNDMAKIGLDAYGVERDPTAISIGDMVYGLPRQRITRGDCVPFLQNLHRKFDVVSCFSLLHHFVMGKGPVTDIELIKLLDRATGSVLFLDTGEGKEEWFRDSLKGWTPEHIERWVKENTSFSRCWRLGVDVDNVPPFENKYGRTLFAFMR